MTLSDLASWHAKHASDARFRAENWEATAKVYDTHAPPLPVQAARHRASRDLAIQEAEFHEHAAGLIRGAAGFEAAA